MTFKFSDLYETAEQETARLAEAPVGSTTHSLSKLPVNVEGYLEDRMIELPRLQVHPAARRVVVVPFRNDGRSEKRDAQNTPWRRNDGWWGCIVVSSNDPMYPVGGHRLAISEAELVRGTERFHDITGDPLVVEPAAPALV